MDLFEVILFETNKLPAQKRRERIHKDVMNSVNAILAHHLETFFPQIVEFFPLQTMFEFGLL